MSHIKKILYNKYIFALLKGQQCHRQSYPHLQNVFIGDIVLVKDANLPRLCRWKELIAKATKGQDGLSQGVSLDNAVSTTNKTQCINCPLQHIIPLEPKDTQQSNKNIEVTDNDNSKPVIKYDETRPVRTENDVLDQ